MVVAVEVVYECDDDDDGDPDDDNDDDIVILIVFSSGLWSCKVISGKRFWLLNKQTKNNNKQQKKATMDARLGKYVSGCHMSMHQTGKRLMDRVFAQ